MDFIISNFGVGFLGEPAEDIRETVPTFSDLHFFNTTVPLAQQHHLLIFLRSKSVLLDIITRNMDIPNEKKRKIEDDGATVHHPHKKRRIESDLSTNIDLPAEIMLQIFEKLPTSDSHTILEVCKYWYECSANFPRWTLVGESDHNLGIEISADDAKQANIPFTITTDKSVYVSFNVCTKRFVVKWVAGSRTLQLVTEQGTLVASANIGSKGILAEYMNDNEEVICPEWRIEAYPRNYATYKGSVVSQATFKLFVNVRALEAAAQADKKFPKVELIFEYALNKEVERIIGKEREKFLELTKPLIPCIPPKIDPPKGLKDGFKWHRYQLECISWMKSIEDNVNKEFKFCDLTPWYRAHARLMFSLHNEEVVTPEAADEYISSFKSCGGVLADSVGLGKTLEMIGLILATKDKKLPEFDKNGLFNSNASLIICSNHIALQWASEIAKFTNLKVTQITSMKEATAVTYDDMITSDAVIVANTMLKNKQFLSLGCSKAIVSLAPKSLKTRAAYLNGHLEDVKKKKNRLQIKGPPLDNFHFRRVIVDEAHELLLDNFTLALLISQAKDYCWYVSATPFPSIGLFEATKKLLGIWAPDFFLGKIAAVRYQNFVENGLIMKNLVWRNTKASIQDEYDVPDYEEEVVWVTLHPIEALHYKYDNHYTIDNLTSLNCIRTSNIYSIESRMRWMKDPGVRMREEMRLSEWKAVPNVYTEDMPDEEKKELRVLEKHGSKLFKIFQWLKERIAESDSNKFLFFSRNHVKVAPLLNLLQENDIQVVKFDGNVNHKAKALQQFKEENVKVMILSLDKSASGLNLIEANYVVLLDTMTGSVEESRAYEVQALGRSHRQGQDEKVKLMRFVLKGTHEEELYNRNKSLGRDEQKPLKRSGSIL